MSPEHLDKLIAEAPAELTNVLGDLHTHIREACSAAIEETQDSDTAKPKVKIAVGITIDLSMAPPSWSMTAGVGITRKVTSEAHSLEEDESMLDPDLGKGRKPKGGIEQ